MTKSVSDGLVLLCIVVFVRLRVCLWLVRECYVTRKWIVFITTVVCMCVYVCVCVCAYMSVCVYMYVCACVEDCL